MIEHLSACEQCDLLLEAPILNHSESAHCPRCGHIICQRPKYSLQFTLSFSIACIILFFVANFFPMLSVEKAGLYNEMSLYQAAWQFLELGEPFLFFLIFFVLLLCPSALLLALVYMLLPMIFMRRVMPYTSAIGRWVFYIKHWSMIDVYLIAALASLTKLTSVANIDLGIGLWAYIVFTVCLASALANLDKIRFWRYLDKIKCHQLLRQQLKQI
ncbi:paraquat-inducible protein A [Catenovulum sediminis]|uniref:Paraquat-inducible protein A n=1 Tax=Catenovulum sediminis TaxID=1740262 RepID=A0ABV1RH66_9ALTE|nr:paraquat-inducible protein A [Catenovulum sediminis]